MDLITDGGTQIPHATGCGQQKRKEDSNLWSGKELFFSHLGLYSSAISHVIPFSKNTYPLFFYSFFQNAGNFYGLVAKETSWSISSTNTLVQI